MYKNYIFDLYGTLLDIRTDEWSDGVWDEFAKWLCTRGVKKSKEALHNEYDELVKKITSRPSVYTYPEIDILPVFEKITTPELAWEAGETFRKISTQFVRPYANTFKVLYELKKAGKKIYLLSNAQKVFTMQELINTGLILYFDDIFISSECGCKKPDVEFFKKLTDKHGLKTEESIMIGNDGSCDIAGAAAVGMDAVYIRTEISPENEPSPQCKYVFEDGDIGHVLETVRSYNV